MAWLLGAGLDEHWEHWAPNLFLCLGWLAWLCFRTTPQTCMPWGLQHSVFITAATRFPGTSGSQTLCSDSYEGLWSTGYSLLCGPTSRMDCRWFSDGDVKGDGRPPRPFSSCWKAGTSYLELRTGWGFCRRFANVIWSLANQCLLHYVSSKIQRWTPWIEKRTCVFSFLYGKPWTQICRTVRGARKHVREPFTCQTCFCWMLLLLLAPLGLCMTTGLLCVTAAELRGADSVPPACAVVSLQTELLSSCGDVSLSCLCDRLGSRKPGSRTGVLYGGAAWGELFRRVYRHAS